MLARVPGRCWTKDRKMNRYPATSKVALWECLKLAFPGVVAHGPSGFFVIGEKPATKTKPVAAPAAAPTRMPADKGRVAPVANLVKQLKLAEEAEEAERQMAEMEAQADREQTLRDEAAKFEARKAMEDHGSLEELEDGAAAAKAARESAVTAKGSVEQLRAKYRAENSIQ
jgi:hypothetical protein